MHRWPESIRWLLLFLLFGGAQLLAGCGQKGSLYLPEPSAEHQEEPDPGQQDD